MEMKKSHLFAPILLFSTLPAQALDFQIAAGYGAQYGVLGAQLSAIDGDTKYYVSAGLLGRGIGFNTALSDDKKYAVGALVGRFDGIFSSDTDFSGLTLNYRPNGLAGKGWDFGVGVSYYEREEYSWFSENKSESGVTLLFNLGYAF
ncbi:hypothetical protein [Pseudoalteromonas rubra]|uniref:hypothetical protein n=1 Tax=Pseudoalteromonas rubra TaxID=43658 RepID=UPI000F7B457B|nr:hypothetical protein [Pseudoalteromonas rubra]